MSLKVQEYKITEAVAPMISGDQFHKFVEASSLGLKPGEWPDVIDFNGHKLHKHFAEHFGRDLTKVCYIQRPAIGVVALILTVYND